MSYITSKNLVDQVKVGVFTGIIAFILYATTTIADNENEIGHFMVIDADTVAYPVESAIPTSTKSISTRTGDWLLSISHEQDRQVLSARSADTLVTQSVTHNAVFKRFVFDLNKQRFEPMRQEIRINHVGEEKMREIEELSGVMAVRRYEKLGFSIVKIEADVNPVDIFRKLKDDFDGLNARILSGFREDEPM